MPLEGERLTPIEKRNHRIVAADAVAVGITGGASPFLPVFLARLGASNFQVGLLAAMPALGGLLLAIPSGRFLQSRRNIVPWFAAGRLSTALPYTLTGLASLLLPRDHVVVVVLLIWGVAAVPHAMHTVGLQVVMSDVAGPRRRYELMSRRWSILGLTEAIMVAVAGQILDHLGFPVNYQVVFIAFSVGGMASAFLSSRIVLPEVEPPAEVPGTSIRKSVQSLLALVQGERPFLCFVRNRFVYAFGVSLSSPLFPLYYVRHLQASDAWIGIIGTTHMAVMLVGYYIWARESRRRGSRFVLLVTTLGLSFYPAVIAVTQQVEYVVLYAGLAAILQGGLDLVFFDELMRTVPPARQPTFVSLAQTTQHFTAVMGPLLGTALADQIGIAAGLMVGSVVRFLGFVLFAMTKDVAASGHR